jgi:hypothetical protein
VSNLDDEWLKSFPLSKLKTELATLKARLQRSAELSKDDREATRDAFLAVHAEIEIRPAEPFLRSRLVIFDEPSSSMRA